MKKMSTNRLAHLRKAWSDSSALELKFRVTGLGAADELAVEGTGMLIAGNAARDEDMLLVPRVLSSRLAIR